MARLILIADDSPIIQRKAQKILQDEGFDVETVSNGVAAIKKLPTLQPVLVLADVSMPGKDGYEVCEFVKTSAGFFHVPVLLVGSDLEPYDEQRGAQVKADGIIKKPFAPQDLIAMVRKLTGIGEAPASQPTLADSRVAPPPTALPGPSEDVPGGLSEPFLAPTEPFPEFAHGLTLEPTPEPIPEAVPEPTSASPEISSEGGAEAVPPPSLVVTEPTPEPVPEAAPEPVLVSSDLIMETPPEARSEPVSVAPEPVAELGLPSLPESVGEAVHLLAEAAPETHPPVPIEGVSLPTEPILAETHFEPTQPATGPAETKAVRAAQAEAARAGEAVAGEGRAIDREWVYMVVRKVVMKMAPPALGPELVEELVHKLTEEITAELDAASPRT